MAVKGKIFCTRPELLSSLISKRFCSGIVTLFFSSLQAQATQRAVVAEPTLDAEDAGPLPDQSNRICVWEDGARHPANTQH